MDIREIVRKNRSYRRFDESKALDREKLLDLVSLARNSPSGANLQPLKFYVSSDKGTNGKIFPHLKWAGYLSNWNGPEEGERPTGYILVLRDRSIKEVASKTDAGIQMQSMLLGAVEQGLGGCIIASVDREAVMSTLGLNTDAYELMFVLALGVPAEEVVIEEVGADGDIKYYRDDNGVHYVPKRTLEDLVIEK